MIAKISLRQFCASLIVILLTGTCCVITTAAEEKIEIYIKGEEFESIEVYKRHRQAILTGEDNPAFPVASSGSNPLVPDQPPFSSPHLEKIPQNVYKDIAEMQEMLPPSFKKEGNIPSETFHSPRIRVITIATPDRPAVNNVRQGEPIISGEEKLNKLVEELKHIPGTGSPLTQEYKLLDPFLLLNMQQGSLKKQGAGFPWILRYPPNPKPYSMEPEIRNRTRFLSLPPLGSELKFPGKDQSPLETDRNRTPSVISRDVINPTSSADATSSILIDRNKPSAK